MGPLCRENSLPQHPSVHMRGKKLMKHWKFVFVGTALILIVGFYSYADFPTDFSIPGATVQQGRDSNNAPWDLNGLKTTAGSTVMYSQTDLPTESIDKFLAELQTDPPALTAPPTEEERQSLILAGQIAKAELSVLSPVPHARSVVIVTTWRSGSTFLGELLTTFPATFYHYEPFMRFGFDDLVKEKSNVRQAVKDLRNLLLCDYSHLDGYLNHAQLEPDIFERNVRLNRVCTDRERFCHMARFLTNACSLHPYQVVKEVRLRLDLVSTLLNDQDLRHKLRLVLLVRDPRGTVNSRLNHVEWCTWPVCSDPAILCSDLAHDFNTAIDLHKKYPGSVYVLRFEDLARKPMATASKLFHFLGLPLTTGVTEYIEAHTGKEESSPWTTTRKSWTRVAIWRHKMAFEEVQRVQKACNATMAALGYRIFLNRKSLHKGSTILPFRFPPK